MRASTFYRFLPVSTLCTIYSIPVCALFKGRKSLFPPAAAAGFRPLSHQIQNPLKSSVYIAFSTFIYGPYTPFAISCPGVFRDNTVCVQSSFTSRKTASFSLHAIRVSLPARLPFCTHNARTLWEHFLQQHPLLRMIYIHNRG